MIQVKLYEPQRLEQWNSFLSSCKNQTFLFHRNYMDYHKDRYDDYSLMVFEDDELVSIVPANIDEERNCLCSHSGLTYGGVVLQKKSRSIKNIEYFYHIIKFLNSEKISRFKLKQIPAFYNTIPSDEIDYALFLLKATNYRTDLASLIALQEKIEYQERRLRSIKKAKKLNVEVKEEKDFSNFWNQILEPNLLKRFNIRPVHTVKEISSLAEKNQPRIRQFSAYIADEIFAGCTIFETETTAHTQYISANEYGRKSGILDLLFDELITKYFAHKNYFDFGIFNENEGLKINYGLLDWKEGFGGRSYAHRFFQIDTNNYYKLEDILQGQQ